MAKKDLYEIPGGIFILSVILRYILIYIVHPPFVILQIASALELTLLAVFLIALAIHAKSVLAKRKKNT